ncbi:endonuclease/exonuclease/phosphatase family protein [Tropicibacter naphthalenivorans]|uniref:Endonuclease/exonuclease/phosphatase domain-containing protein n=1 Tax=Tropicibacter naphthalenivorans TaxID=441103 RepID=A0A0P1GX43_9RHOB|nr:endonuclease/exonuclease/phosphatase family protein [Tropicibacter naphthalenivorans]CUH80052.1 hypothetical protein TRN7648_02771 [Tropicibacter naphthalenivorans]SMC84104.1 Uncharacterized conserved protein YafD, endonuclease/exonuclease/phosphatase (EEP) superfamily [Tropicibacter naphthalenivorans]
MRHILAVLAVVLGALVAASYGGAWHPVGDSLAVFRREFVIGFALALIWTGWPAWVRWPLAGLAVAWLGAFVWASRPDTPGAGYVLYQQNLLHNRADSAEWLSRVRVEEPDFLTLQEVSPANLAMLSGLERYVNAVHCPLGRMGEMVMTRHPVVAGSGFCSKRDGIAAVQVDLPEGPVWVVSLHLSWPWPHGQAAQVDQILPALRRISGPVILAGDFNSVAWSHTVARVGAATDARRIGPVLGTFDLPLIKIGIDHVLTSGSGTVQVMPKLGSDHHGLRAVVRP